MTLTREIMPGHSTILLIILTGRPATPAEISDFEEKWSEIFTELRRCFKLFS
jgi:hypothetical protein